MSATPRNRGPARADAERAAYTRDRNASAPRGASQVADGESTCTRVYCGHPLAVCRTCPYRGCAVELRAHDGMCVWCQARTLAALSPEEKRLHSYGDVGEART